MTLFLLAVWIVGFWAVYGLARMFASSDEELAVRAAAEETERRALETARAALDAKRKAWYEQFSEFRLADPGERAYDVVLTGVTTEGSGDARLHALLRILPDVAATDSLEPQRLIERVVHIGPEPVALSLPQEEAIRLKVALESVGARVRIAEATRA